MSGATPRRQRTRETIVSVTRRMMLTETLQPTAGAVAQAAGCSIRTIFQHFGSLPGLYAAAVDDDATADAICARLPLTNHRALALAFVTCRLPGRRA